MKKDEIKKALEQIRNSIEILSAVNALEYYDINWLSDSCVQNPNAWNRDKQEQLDNAFWNLKKLYNLAD